MKKFTVPCDFNGEPHPFDLYVGEPCSLRHPLAYQSQWLSMARGGIVTSGVMDSFRALFTIAEENNVSYEELCVYGLGAAPENDTVIELAEIRRGMNNAWGPLLSNQSMPDAMAFGLMPLPSDQIAAFVRTLAAQIIAADSTDDQRIHLARLLLGMVLFIILACNANDWIKSLAGYLSTDRDNPAEYQIAVALDTVGYLLPMDLLVAGDFFVFSTEETQTEILNLIREQIQRWIGSPTSIMSLNPLEKYGMSVAYVNSLKKSLKTAFSQV